MLDDNFDHIEVKGRLLLERQRPHSDLCSRCSYGVIYRAKGESQAKAYCSLLKQQIPLDIVECSAFDQRNEISLYDLKEIALTIDTRLPTPEKGYR